MKSIYNALNSAYDKLTQGIVVLLSVCVLAVIFLITIQIVSRMFFTPVLWTTDIANCLMVALGFLGSGWLLRQDGHVGIDLLYCNLSRKKQLMLSLVTSTLGTVTSMVLVYVGFKVSYSQFLRGVIIVTGGWDIPKFIVLVMIPIGMVFVTIEFMRKIKHYICELHQLGVEKKLQKNL